MAFKSNSGESHEEKVLRTRKERQAQIRSAQERFAALEPSDIEAYVLIVRGKTDKAGEYRLAIESGGLFEAKLDMLHEYSETLTAYASQKGVKGNQD